MSGIQREVRTVFTASATGLRNAMQGIQKNYKAIQTSGRTTAQAADKDFGKMRTSLLGLQKELQGTGQKTQALNKLQAVAHEVAMEMDKTGKASKESMDRLSAAMKAAGKDTESFKKLGTSGFMALQNDIINVEREMKGIGKTASNVTSEANKGFAQLRKGMMLVTGVAAGISAGVAGAFAFTDQYQNAMNKMQAQTGATAKETEKLGESVKNVYAANYGNDMQDVADSMAQVKIATGATGKELEGLTKYAIGVRDTFGYDIPESTKVAQQMMKQFGISGEQAYNLITQGAQQGLDVNGDMLDTFNEYSVYFKTLGFDAEGMFDVLKAGSDAGALNLDKVGDTIKELGIRVKDGSKSSQQAFTDLGLDADEMAQRFAKGGESSQKALKEVFKRISEIEDPVKRNSVGVSLMGTQFEDLEYKTVAAMGNIKTSVDMNSDALKKMDGVKFNSMSSAIRGVGRIILVEMLDPMQKKVMPMFNKFINNLKDNIPTIKKVAGDTFGGIANFIQKMQPTFLNLWKSLKPIAEVVGIAIYGAFKAIETIIPPITNALSFLLAKFTNMKGFVPIMTGILAAFATFRLYLLAMRVPAMVIQTISVLTRTWAVAQMLLNTVLLANPIGLIIAAVAGLVAAFVVAYKRSETFRNFIDKLWSAIKTGASAVMNWLKTNWPTLLAIITGPIGLIVLAVVKNWDSIKSSTISIFNAVKDFIVSAFHFIKDTTIRIVQGYVNNVKNNWNTLKNGTITIYNAIKDFIISAFTWIKDTAVKIAQAYINQVKNNWNALKSATVTIYNGIKSFLSNVWTSMKNTALKVASALWNGVKSTWNALKTGTMNIFNSTKKFLSDLWTYLKTYVTKTAQALWNGVKNTWNALKTGTSNIFNAVKKFLTNLWDTIKKSVTKTAQSLWNGIKTTWNALKTGTSNIFNSVRKFLTDLWNGIKNFTTKSATNIKDGVVKSWQTLKSKTVSLFQDIKKSVSKVFDDIVGGAKKLPKRIGDGIKSMAKGVNAGITSFKKTLVGALGKGINGAIGGINWVLKKLDVDTIKEWPIPKYKDGTKNGKHQGGLAWLGDGGEHELYRTPDGKVGLSPATDTLMNLPKGTEVLSGSQTKEAFANANIPMYDSGSGVKGALKKGASMAKDYGKKAVGKGQELLEHAGEKAKDAGKKVKDLALDVWDWMDKPKELMKKVYDKFVPSLPKIGSAAGDMLKGGMKKVKDSSIGFIQKKMDEFMSFSGGGGDGSTVGAGSGFGGMHPYVEAYYNRIKDKFGPTKFMGAYNNRNVRGGSSKSMHAYGRAFDVGGSGKVMSKIAEYARTTFKDLQYVIYNRRIAGIGKGSKWRHYSGQNPHTDHVHIDFKTGGGGKGGPSGKGAEAWRSQIIKASKQMKANASPSEINGIIAQIHRESKGDQSIIQSPNLRDINVLRGTPAQGLLQYVPSTFHRYMVKGHTNIKNGYDQLLAFFNNSTWRSDLPYGRSGWGPKGKRRFAKGGVIDSQEEIIAGEDGKREAIIPLDRFRARAVQLFKFVGEELGFDMKTILGSGNFDISSSSILNHRAPSIGFSGNTSVDASDASKTSGDINITMPVEIHGGATKEQADMFVSVALPKIKKELIKDMERYRAKQGRKTN